MNHIHAIRTFAESLVRTPLYDCGHADPWSMVAKGDARDMVRMLAYAHGYADACRLACEYMTPAWQIAQLLGIAAGTFATVIEQVYDGESPRDCVRLAATYTAELTALLEAKRVQS